MNGQRTADVDVRVIVAVNERPGPFPTLMQSRVIAMISYTTTSVQALAVYVETHEQYSRLGDWAKLSYRSQWTPDATRRDIPFGSCFYNRRGGCRSRRLTVVCLTLDRLVILLRISVRLVSYQAHGRGRESDRQRFSMDI